MKEFKVNSALLQDVGDMKTAGIALNDGCSKVDASGVASLDAAKRFAEQCESVQSLMSEYIQLVDKDVREIMEAVAAAQMNDAGLAESFLR